VVLFAQAVPVVFLACSFTAAPFQAQCRRRLYL